MTFDIRPPGLVIDGQTIIGQTDTTPGGGRLVPDKQKLQRRTPTSEVDFEWDGYTERTLEIALRMASKVPRGALPPYAALALLHRAHRGGGNVPNEHTVVGALATALGFDTPWAIMEIIPTEGLNLEVVIHMVELDPEAVSEGTAEVDPGSGDPEDPPLPDPDDQVPDDVRLIIGDLEETLLGPGF